MRFLRNDVIVSALYTYTHAMYNNTTKSKFNRLARIKKSQLDWLKKHKNKHKCRTVAGFLDLIINDYKKYEKKSKNVSLFLPEMQLTSTQIQINATDGQGA